MRRQLLPALRMLVVMTLLTGAFYTFAVTGLAQALFTDLADGSLVVVAGEVVGSELLGQRFDEPGYFHPRPSAVGYDPSLSGGTNLGPVNPGQIAAVAGRAERFRRTNGLDTGSPVPVDAVTASASGLDPHISVSNARLQAPRIASERGLNVEQVMALIEAHRASTLLDYLADPSVNVLRLNVALDGL